METMQKSVDDKLRWVQILADPELLPLSVYPAALKIRALASEIREQVRREGSLQEAIKTLSFAGKKR
jgi:hypothetical protein